MKIMSRKPELSEVRNS